MKTTASLALALIMFVCLTGCDCPGLFCSENCPDVYTETPPELAAWFVFPEGSWWAYENDKNDRIDTLWYFTDRSNIIESYTYDSDCPIGYEHGVDYLNYSLYTYIDVDMSCTSPESDCSVEVDLDWNSEKNEWVRFSLSYNPEVDAFDYRWSNDVFDLIHLDSMLEFKSVVELINKEQSASVAFSKNVGIFAFNVNDTSFSLINYSIQ